MKYREQFPLRYWINRFICWCHWDSPEAALLKKEIEDPLESENGKDDSEGE